MCVASYASAYAVGIVLCVACVFVAGPLLNVNVLIHAMREFVHFCNTGCLFHVSGVNKCQQQVYLLKVYQFVGLLL
jgi:hypothetical protein